MSQTIKLKRSSIPGAKPLVGQLELGEIAINTSDGKVFAKINDGTEQVIEIAGKYFPTRLDDITAVDGVATYNLTKNASPFEPSLAEAMLVSVNGVTQEPIESYTVSGSTITFIPALSSTDVVDYIVDLGKALDVLGSLDYLQLSTLAVIDPVAPGQIAWNPDEETINVGLNNDVTLQVGQETLIHVKAAETLSDGDVVYASGAVGNSGTLEVSKYIANNTIDELLVVGIATQDIAVGEFGFVAAFGKVRGISTDGSALTTPEVWIDGTILYASPVVPGELTSIQPEAPNQDIPIAFVLSASAGNGTLFVRAYELGYHLNEIHDVFAPSPSTGDTLVWNQTNERWENTQITESLISDFGTYQPTSEKGAANGYASLDAGGKVPTAQLPALAITDVSVVADEAARLALTVEEGDVAIQTDIGNSYIYDGSSWLELSSSETDTLQSVTDREASSTNAITITNTTTSTTTTSGALTVTGGVGIAENLNVGGQFINFVPNSGTYAAGNPSFFKSQDASSGVAFAQFRSRGTFGTPTALVDGDIVGGFSSLAHDGTNYHNTAAIRYKIDGTVGTGVVPQKIVFETSETDGTGLTERLTIKPNGNVGIGTDNPANNGLTIQKSGFARLRLAEESVRSWDMEATGGDWRLNNASNSLEAIRVDENAVVTHGGFGQYRFSTTAQSSIETNINKDGNHSLSGTFAARRNIVNVGSNYVSWDVSDAKAQGSAPVWTTQMRLDSSGNVGIGTSSPSALLDVAGDLEASTRKGREVYLGGTLNWVRIYYREFESTSFNYGTHYVTVLMQGSTLGENSGAKLLIGNKQQGTSKYPSTQWIESFGSHTMTVAAYYNPTGGPTGFGTYEVWVKPPLAYMQIAVISDSLSVYSSASSGLIFAENTGSVAQPDSSTLLTPSLRITSSIAESAVTMQVSNTTPVLALNDTDATTNTNQVGYISFRRQGTETGWVGFGDSVNDSLTVRNSSGPVVLYPSTEVQVASNLDVTGNLEINSTATAWSETTPGTTIGSIHLNPSNTADNVGNAITWGAHDSSSGNTAQAGIYVRSDGSYGTKMYFATTDAYAAGSKVRMSIDHLGNVNMGGSLTVSGDVNSLSDARLKTDVETITEALDKVKSLRGVSYTKDNKQSIGLIAQEVMKVLPQAISGSEEEYYSVAYGNMVSVLIEAIKELEARVAELESK